APSPHGDAIEIDVRPAGGERPERRRLLLRRQDANRPVHRLAPGAAARRGRAGVVEADHEIAEAGQVAVEERGAAAPAIFDRLRCRLAVDVDQDRVTPRWIEVARL